MRAALRPDAEARAGPLGVDTLQWPPPLARWAAPAGARAATGHSCLPPFENGRFDRQCSYCDGCHYWIHSNLSNTKIRETVTKGYADPTFLERRMECGRIAGRKERQTAVPCSHPALVSAWRSHWEVRNGRIPLKPRLKLIQYRSASSRSDVLFVYARQTSEWLPLMCVGSELLLL